MSTASSVYESMSAPELHAVAMRLVRDYDSDDLGMEIVRYGAPYADLVERDPLDESGQLVLLEVVGLPLGGEHGYTPDVGYAERCLSRCDLDGAVRVDTVAVFIGEEEVRIERFPGLASRPACG